MYVTEMATGKDTRLFKLPGHRKTGWRPLTDLTTVICFPIRLQAFLVPLKVPHGDWGPRATEGVTQSGHGFW